jgi:hypothetical protein
MTNIKSKPIDTCKDTADKVCRAMNCDPLTRNLNDCSWRRSPGSCLVEFITSSIPFIGMNQTIVETWIGRISQRIHTFIQFVIPRFPTTFNGDDDHHHRQYYSLELQQQLPKAIRDIWDSIANATQHHSSGSSDFMLRHFDTNHDGTISSNELLNMTEFVRHMIDMVRSSTTMTPPHLVRDMSWITWFRREWPLMDWKLGVFIWRSFGGILFVLAVLSIIPGRLHGISGKLLRWPVLGMTYFLITVELVYGNNSMVDGVIKHIDVMQIHTNFHSFFFYCTEFILSFDCSYVSPNISLHDQSIEGCVNKWRYPNRIRNGTNMRRN